MSHGLTDYGGEAITKHFWTDEVTRPSSVRIGLYNDTIDDLTSGQDVDAISTEPEGSNYSRASVDFGTDDMTSRTEGEDWYVEFDSRAFNTSDSSQTVDSYFVVMDYESAITGDASPNTHLIFTAPLDTDYDLSNYSSPTLERGGLLST